MRVAEFSLRTTVALAALVIAGSAMAQSAPVRLRGTISAIDGETVTIATREGTNVDVKLADKWSVMLVSPISASDIKEGIFVGVASISSGGHQSALEVLVFPEAARGAGEGHYPWDLRPDSMMTNAEVASVVSNNGAQTLMLAYKDKQGAGRQTIEVKPGTPIVTFSPGTQSDAKIGLKVFTGAQKAEDGTFSANRLLVGKDGLTPPM